MYFNKSEVKISNYNTRHLTRGVLTNLSAYLALFEAAHTRGEAQSVLLGACPLPPQVDNGQYDEPNEDNAVGDNADDHADLALAE